MTVDVQFAMATPGNVAVTAAPVRMVVGEPAGWQASTAGTRFTTGADGKFQLTVQANPVGMRRKLPTNFWSSLLSKAQPTQHFTIAVELPYLGKQWLYVASADYFPDGTTAQLDVMRVFGKDAQGNFTVPVTFANGQYSFPGIPGSLSVPGHSVSQFSLQPDASGKRWSIHVAFTRHPEPVRR